MLFQIGEGGGFSGFGNRDNHIGVDRGGFFLVFLFGFSLSVFGINEPGEGVEGTGAGARKGPCFLARGDVPDLDFLIVASGGNALALGGKSGSHDVAGMAFESGYNLVRGSVTNGDELVRRGRRVAFPIDAEGDREDGIAVGGVKGDDFFRLEGDLVEPSELGRNGIGDEDFFPVWEEAQSSLPSEEGFADLARRLCRIRRIPEAHRAKAARDEPFSIGGKGEGLHRVFFSGRGGGALDFRLRFARLARGDAIPVDLAAATHREESAVGREGNGEDGLVAVGQSPARDFGFGGQVQLHPVVGIPFGAFVDPFLESGDLAGVELAFWWHVTFGVGEKGLDEVTLARLSRDDRRVGVAAFEKRLT